METMNEVWVDVRRSDNRKCITTQKAFALQKSLDISELAATLTSETVKVMENEGWRYCKVLKELGSKDGVPEAPKYQGSKYEYMVIPIEKNRYGDCVLFSRLPKRISDVAGKRTLGGTESKHTL